MLVIASKIWLQDSGNCGEFSVCSGRLANGLDKSKSIRSMFDVSTLIIVILVFLGSIPQALERHFLTALPFLFQSLITVSSPRKEVMRVFIKRLF